MSIKVLLAEDQGMVRGALAALLSLQHDIEVVAEVERGDRVVAAALEHQPDVALLDIEMPGMDGLAAAAALREALPGCRTLILTTFGRPGYLRRAMDLGVYGFLVKDGPAGELAAAIRRAAAGQRTVDPGLAAAALAEGAGPLSEREREVLAAARDGGTAAEIAPASTCRRGPSATTSRPPSARPAPAAGWRRCGPPRTRAGCRRRHLAAGRYRRLRLAAMPPPSPAAILTRYLHPREMERRWADSEAGAAG